MSEENYRKCDQDGCEFPATHTYVWTKPQVACLIHAQKALGIPIKRFVVLGKMADKAARDGDMATIATINQDKELRSANAQFIVRGKATWIARLDELQAGKQFEDATWPHGEEAP